MVQRPNAIRARLTASVEKQRELLNTFQELLKDPDANSAAIEQTQRQLSRMAAERTQLLTEWRLARGRGAEVSSSYAGVVGQRPMREQVLDILDELCVPATPRVISEIAVARYGRPLPAARFASLRRDEERACRKDPLSRPAWVVPALTAHGLTAIPRIVGSSAWPAERRVIGARTLRANHLRTLLALISMRERTERTGPSHAAGHLETMIFSFAQTVPGAVEFEHATAPAAIRVDLPPGSGKTTHALALAKMAETARVELGQIDKQDLEERQAAARRLERLPELQRLWGQPAVIEGRRAFGRRSG